MLYPLLWSLHPLDPGCRLLRQPANNYKFYSEIIFRAVRLLFVVKDSAS